jgi:7-cyano-7-deazaguanine synthase
MSGGLDSTTIVGNLLMRKFKVFPLSINYGQRHAVEMEAMKSIVQWYQDQKQPVENVFELKLPDLARIGGSALTDTSIDVPDKMIEGIPVTYVPGRNTIFLSIALAYAEVKKCKSVAIGVNALDYSGYPDCRPEYIKAVAEVARLSSKRAVEGKPILIDTPIITMKKSEIIKMGMTCRPAVPYHLTWSCYNPQEIKGTLGEKLKGVKKWKPCGTCDSCTLRAKGFKEADTEDPALKETTV